MKKILLLSLSLILLLSFSKPTLKKSDTPLKNPNSVVIGIDDTFVPMGFKDEKGEIIGFDIDLAKEAFKRLNLNPVFQPIDWSMKESELTNKNIDFIWNGYSVTEEREKKVSFTKPYLKNRQVIVTLKSSNINTLKDLKGKSLTTQDGSSSLNILFEREDITKNLKNGEPVLFDSFNDCFMDLESKRSDALLCDEVLAKYYISKRNPERFKILEEDLGEESYSVGLRKNSPLLEPLNEALDNMKEDGTLEKIYKKWFGNF